MRFVFLFLFLSLFLFSYDRNSDECNCRSGYWEIDVHDTHWDSPTQKPDDVHECKIDIVYEPGHPFGGGGNYRGVSHVVNYRCLDCRRLHLQPAGDGTCICPSGQIFDNYTSSCVLPSCDDNQVLYNGQCVDCPPHSHPDSNQTQCTCDDGRYLSDMGTCDIPCQYPEFYNPDTDTCDTSDCPPDKVPVYDHGEVVCYNKCPAGNFSSLTDCRCEPPQIRQALPGGDFTCSSPDVNNSDNGDNSDDNSSGNSDDGNGDDDGGNSGNDDNNCPHPDKLFGASFAGVMSYEACMMNDGWSVSCPDDNKVACYYQSDDNSSGNSDDGNGDDDSSDNSDVNGSGTIDNNSSGNSSDANASSYDNYLRQIIQRLDQSNLIAKDTSKVISSGFSTTNNNLRRIDGSIGRMNDNLGQKLDDIKSAIDSKSDVDLSETNDLLSQINDRLHEDSDDKQSDMSDRSNQLLNIIDQATDAIQTNYNDIVAVMNGLTPPSLSGSGSCDLHVVVLGRSIDLSSGFRDALPIIRPVVMFIMNLVFSILLIKFSILAYRDVMFKAFELFHSGG